MAEKHIYTSQFPNLKIAGLCKFEGGLLKTDDDYVAAELDSLLNSGKRPDLTQAIKKLDQANILPGLLDGENKSKDNAVAGPLNSMSGSEGAIREMQQIAEATGAAGGKASDGSDLKVADSATAPTNNPGANLAAALAASKAAQK